MKDLIARCVSSDSYNACWESTPPCSYEVFLDTAVEKIAAQLEAPAKEIDCRAKSDGNNRLRVDGVLLTETGRFNLCLELVWLPALEMFRGKARLRPLAEGQPPLAMWAETESESEGEGEGEELVPFMVTPLVTILAELERKNGRPLTESEVLEVRDNAPCIALPPEMAASMQEQRGDADIDPENCWAEWLAVREQFLSE